MFGIGTSELLVVAVLALLLFPPKELPKILRGITQLWGTLRRTADEFKDAILQEEALQDLKDAVDGTKAQLRDVEGAARRELMKARMEARRAENKLLKVSRERERIEREAAAKQQAEGGGASEGAKPEGGASPAAPSPAVGSPAVTSPEASPSAPASPSALASRPVPASPPVAPSTPVASPAPANTVAAGSSVGSGDSANQGAA